MAWQTPKKDWTAVNIPNPNDFNRIEGNTDELKNTKFDKAGGTITGNVSLNGNLDMNKKQLQKSEIKDYSETAVVATGVTGTRALDLSTGNVFDMTLSGNTTFTFNNPPASGKAGSFTLIIRQPSTLRTVTFPSSVKWNSDSVPGFVASKVAVLTFVTVNGGARWYGFLAGNNFTA